MIGVICRPDQRALAEELFQLLKVPWYWADTARHHEALLVTDTDVAESALDAELVLRFCAGQRESTDFVNFPGEAFRLPLYTGATDVDFPGAAIGLRNDGRPLAVERREAARTEISVGYDLLDELGYLLEFGQPESEAATPTLDLHLELLRRWIVGAGVPLVELLPTPWGSPYVACLTHDLDFVGIRRHGLDHTVLGFAYRASIGTLRGVLHGRRTWRQLARNLAALGTLPLVHLGVVRDFWRPFDDYEVADGDLPSTFFVIPFRDRAGERVPGRRPALRATRYDVRDVAARLPGLERRGSEVAVHGIDAWHSAGAGRAEHAAVAAEVGRSDLGVRMHWLCYDRATPGRLEEAGFDWDATFGYNGAVGYRAGTTQVFGPPGTRRLLEVPLHAQDTALFLPQRLDLSEADAWDACSRLRDHARAYGGALTITWHDRSLAPERLWDGFYRRLLGALRADGAWFATVSTLVAWMRIRRAARMVDVEIAHDCARIRLEGAVPVVDPPFILRLLVRGPDGDILSAEAPWRGETLVELALPRGAVSKAEAWPSG